MLVASERSKSTLFWAFLQEKVDSCEREDPCFWHGSLKSRGLIDRLVLAELCYGMVVAYREVRMLCEASRESHGECLI